MFKSVNKDVWAFDVEWVPDPDAGRRLYQLPEDTPDAEVIQKMWEEGGADEETLMPYSKPQFAALFPLPRSFVQIKEMEKWPCL